MLSLVHSSSRHMTYKLQYNLFSSQIIHGDCLNIQKYSLLSLNTHPADILITDPPYCILNRRRIGGDLRDDKKIIKKITNQETVPKYNNLKEYRIFTEQWLSIVIKHGLKPSVPLIVWTNVLGKQVIINVCQSLGYNLRG